MGHAPLGFLLTCNEGTEKCPVNCVFLIEDIRRGDLERIHNIRNNRGRLIMLRALGTHLRLERIENISIRNCGTSLPRVTHVCHVSA